MTIPIKLPQTPKGAFQVYKSYNILFKTSDNMQVPFRGFRGFLPPQSQYILPRFFQKFFLNFAVEQLKTANLVVFFFSPNGNFEDEK